jgi:glycosyltransferase involved in cell wall biosynthesis
MSRTTSGSPTSIIRATSRGIDASGPLITHLRRNSCRSERHRLFYVAVPKAACTSIKWWFAELEGVREAVEAASAWSAESDPETTIHDLLPRVAPAVSDLDPDSIRSVLASDRYLRFSVVRHPVPRLFSAWQSKILLEEPLQVGPYLGLGILERRIEHADDIASAFEAFLEHLAANEAGAFRDVHWTPQQELLRPDLIDYAMIARMEEPSALRAMIAEHLDVAGADPLGGAFRNRSIVPYSASLVTERAAALIRELHASDFETFGYADLPPRGGRAPRREECRLLDRAVRLIRGRHRRIAEQHASISARDEVLRQRTADLRAAGAKLAQAEAVAQQAAGLEHRIESLQSARAELESKLAVAVEEQEASRVRVAAALEEAERAIATEKEGRLGLERMLADRETRLVETGSALAGERRRVAALEGELRASGEAAVSLEARLAEEISTVARLESLLDSKSEEIESLESTLAESRSQHELLESRRLEQERRGDVLESSLAAAREAMQSLEVLHEEAKVLVERLRGEVALLREILKVRDAELVRDRSEAAQRANSLLESIGALESAQLRDRRDLEDLSRTRSRLESELARLRASRSWKVTRPLRFLGRVLRGEWILVRRDIARATGLGRSRDASRPSVPIVARGAGPLRRSALAIESAAFRSLRTIYRAWPVPIERKRGTAERAIMRLPRLRRIAQRLATEEIVPAVAEGRPSAPAPTPSRSRALVVEHRIPTPDRTSGSTRLAAIIEAIVARGWEVTVASHARREDYHWVLSDVEAELPRYEQALASQGVRTIFGPAAIAEHLREHGGGEEMVFLSYPEVMHHYAPLVRTAAPSALLVYDTVDLHGLRFRREAESKGGDLDLLGKADLYDAMESANLEIADLSIAITDVEAEEIRRRRPDARVAVVPNIHAARREAPGFAERRGLLFIGHYLHAPNEDAMRYFVAEVLPRIERRLNEPILYMLGSSITESVRALARRNVEAVGFVEDPTPWFDQCRVFVAPLRFGAGMKGKIGQSMSLGLPVVTTSIGAEGMRIESGVHALVADDPEAFAEAVARVHEDPGLWARLAAGGTDLIERNFSAEAAGTEIDRILAVARDASRA